MGKQKYKYYQGFTTIDLILTLSIMFTIVSIVTPIIFNGIETSKVDRARKEISKLAQESVFLPLVEENKGRTIASDDLSAQEKSMGIDPWGRPYRKNIVRDMGGKPAHVVVWSLGPNGVAETSNIDPDQRRERFTVRFGGDDFGTIASLGK